MTSKGDALALAIALSSSEETLLGPTDSQICATALRHYAREGSRSRLLHLTQLIALVCAVLMGASALTYEAPVISAVKGTSTSKAIAFENAAPIPHLWLDAPGPTEAGRLTFDGLPSSIEVQSAVAAATDEDG
ncbi:butyrophilin subfamily 1 [Bradyrhizobium oligotrophicum S58]|uniref:Butyrophilin subfamily 1 n=1 Tax=Bradyrhizobium oligotrophicum S58 TaxID=1245469 RepID=M4Z2X8_9BRAD|nr:hypothetical protein [Bradyrhizobium oligotrophicum]BAM87653.1 butyrophilin subfamily 1 [Bradyrhizobium oligotrophicum S58]